METGQPLKLAGATVEEDGDEVQNTAMERVASNKHCSKRKLNEEGSQGTTDEKAINSPPTR